MEILNTTNEQIITGYTWGYHWSCIFGSILGVIGLLLIVILIASWIMGEGDAGDLWLFLAGGLFITLGILSWHSEPIYKEVPTYQVTINDEVTFHEIYDKYDVIEENGEIYTLRDKGWESAE